MVFISPEFTKYQQHAIGFKDFAIQLWKIHKYKNGLVIFDEVKPLATKESVTSIAKSNSATKKVSQEIRVYTEDDLLKIADDSVTELYSDIKSGILRFSKDIEIRPKKKYISFRRNQAFVGFIFVRSKIKAYLNIQLSHLHDPLKKARDVEGIGHYSHGDTEITITELSEAPYALTLIKQSYDRN